MIYKVALICFFALMTLSAESNDLTEELAQEIAECSQEFGENAAAFEQRLLSMAAQPEWREDRNIVRMITYLRYQKQQKILTTNILNEMVRKQLVEMGLYLRKKISAATTTQIEMENGEFIDTCLFQRVLETARAPEVFPYFRTPLPSHEVERWKELIDKETQQMSGNLDFFVLNENNLISGQAPKQLNGRFFRQSMQQLVVAPIVAYENSRIKPIYRSLIEKYNLAETSELDSQDETVADQTELDLLRSAHERIYSLVLSLIPALNSSQDGNAWHTFDIRVDTSTQFPPHSQLSGRIRLSKKGHWWILLFSDFQSTDGNLLAEKELLRKCFAFDTSSRSFYVFDREHDELELLSNSSNWECSESAYFLNSYRFGELKHALNVVLDLLHSSDLSTIPSLESMSPATRVTCNDNVLKDAVLKSIEIAPVTLRALLGMHSAKSRVPVSKVMFPDGCSYEGIESDASKVVAPSRVAVRMRINSSEYLDGNSSSSDVKSAHNHCRILIAQDPFVRSQYVIDRMNSTPSDDEQRATLATLDHLEQMTDLPTSWAWKLNDLRCGALLQLDQRAEMLASLARQVQYVRAHPDPAFRKKYFDHYQSLVRRKNENDPALQNSRYSFVVPEQKNNDRKPNRLEHKRLVEDTDIESLAALIQPPENVKFSVDFRADYVAYASEQLVHALSGTPEELITPNIQDEIASFWKARWDQVLDDPDSERRIAYLNTMVWRTYHRIRAAHQPLTAAEIASKEFQITQLSTLLNETVPLLRNHLSRPLPDKLFEAAQEETARSLRRLVDYSDSAFYPEFYFPLRSDQFNDAIKKTRLQRDKHLQGFSSTWNAEVSKSLRKLKNDHVKDGNIDFFNQRLRIWFAQQSRLKIALTMGSLVRHYGLVYRHFDYGDRQVFPCNSVRGLSLVYRMQSGLSTEIHYEWALDSREINRP